MQLKIVEFPDPVLRRATRPVTVFDEALKTFVDEMTIVMKDDDGVGIAAPQVGVSKKVAVVCFEGERYVLVNPVIVEATGTQRGEEGCLSFPGIFGEVERAERVVVGDAKPADAHLAGAGHRFGNGQEAVRRILRRMHVRVQNHREETFRLSITENHNMVNHS